MAFDRNVNSVQWIKLAPWVLRRMRIIFHDRRQHCSTFAKVTDATAKSESPIAY